MLAQASIPESDESSDGAEDEDEQICDGGKNCLCGKKPEKQPRYKWATAYACRRKYLAQVPMAHFRDPANSNMSTYAYHEGDGMMELV